MPLHVNANVVENGASCAPATIIRVAQAFLSLAAASSHGRLLVSSFTPSGGQGCCTDLTARCSPCHTPRHLSHV